MFLITRGFFAATGVPAANRAIDVFERDDHVTRPPLFDLNLAPISNPAVTDDLGNLTFYIAAGEFEFHVNGYRIPFDTAAGGGGAVAPIKFHQAVPAATWTVLHDRNTKPPVLLITDSDGDQTVFTDVTYPDDSTIVIEWPSAESGWAYVQ
jgi:hypothetical protein